MARKKQITTLKCRRSPNSSKGASILSTAFKVGQKAISVGRKAIAAKNKVLSTITKAKHHTRNIINKGKYAINHTQAAILDKVKPGELPRTITNKIDYINNAKANEVRSPDVAKEIWKKEAAQKRDKLDKSIKQHFEQRVRAEEAVANNRPKYFKEMDKSFKQFKDLGLSHAFLDKARQDPMYRRNYADPHKISYGLATAPFRAPLINGAPSIPPINEQWKSTQVHGGYQNGKGQKKC